MIVGPCLGLWPKTIVEIYKTLICADDIQEPFCPYLGFLLGGRNIGPIVKLIFTCEPSCFFRFDPPNRTAPNWLGEVGSLFLSNFGTPAPPGSSSCDN